MILCVSKLVRKSHGCYNNKELSHKMVSKTKVHPKMSRSQGSLFVPMLSFLGQLKLGLYYHQINFHYHHSKNQYSPNLQQFINRKCTPLRNHKLNSLPLLINSLSPGNAIYTSKYIHDSRRSCCYCAWADHGAKL